MSSKIAGLDHLRALAITLVFLFHYRLFDHPAWVDTVGDFGWTGVDLFFVLSGFLIATQIFTGLKAGTFSLPEFFLKRFFRILPAYWVVLSLYFLWPAFREWESLPPLWKLLSFTQNFGLDLRYHRTFSHAWSLCIEEQFYLMLPFTLVLLQYLKAGRKSVAVLIALFMAGCFCRICSWQYFVAPAVGTDTFFVTWYKHIYYPTYNRLDGLLAGIAIAAAFQYTSRLRAFIMRYANVLLAGGMLLIAAAWHLCRTPQDFIASVWGYPLIALSFGLIVAVAASAGSILNKGHSRITTAIATLSYSIYLTHKAAVHVTQQQAPKLGIAADSSFMFVLSVIVSILMALILHYSIEKPFLKWKEHLLKRRAANSIVAVKGG